MKKEEENPRREFRKRNLEKWVSFLHDLFNNKVPQSKTWNSKSEIISILNSIGTKPNLTHLFFPNGGGLDLTGAKNSYENNCIELLFDRSAYIVKPDYLSFESFGEDELEWAYFRLETLALNPSGVYEDLSLTFEELTELSPNNYVDRNIWDQGFVEYDENGYEVPLPKKARVVTRTFSGSFVIFAKGSIYNATPDTYDAMHNGLTAYGFRKNIKDAIEYLKNK